MVLAVKLVVLWQLHDHPLLQPTGEMDSGVYLDLARAVAGGDLLAGHQVFFVSPLYVYFAAFVLALSGGSILVLQVAQAVLGTAAVVLVALTARAWFGPRAAPIAGVLAGLTGVFTFNEVVVLQSALDPFLAALGLWLLALAWSSTGAAQRRYALLHFASGAVLGLHILNRPNIALWAAAAAGLSAILALRAGRRSLVGPAALVAGLLLALAPVAVRNHVVAGQFAPVSSHGGLNFYTGNNPEADGTYHMVAGVTPSIAGQARDMRTVASRALGRPVTDIEASSWFYGEAWRWIRSAPADAAVLFGRKLLYLLNAVDLPLNYSYAFYRDESGTLLPFLFVGAWLLVPLGVAGLWFRPAGHQPGSEAGSLEWWCWASFVAVYAVSVAAFFVAGRYRLPLLVAFCITASGTLSSCWERWRADRWRSVVLCVVTVAALGALGNLDLRLDDGRAAERTELLLHEIDNRRDGSAEALLERTLRESQDPALVLYRAAQAFRARSDPALAVPLLQRAQRLAPARAEISGSLGQALLDAGRPSEAIEPLRMAQGATGNQDVMAFDLARALAASGFREDARTALGGIRGVEKMDADSLLAAGRLALDLGDPALAHRFLAPAAARAPDRASVQESLGLSFGLLARRAEAVAALEAACRLDPLNATTRLNLAVMYGEAGRLPDARRTAEEALRLRPDYQRAREFLAALGR